MAKPNVHIRVDGSEKIGLGHIYRCMALAQMLNKLFSITFWAKQIPESLKEEIRGHYGFQKIATEEVFFDEIKKTSPKPVVVCDGYQFESEYQKELKKSGLSVVCIDDIHTSHFWADVVINHAPGICKADYSVEDYTKLYLGPDYALLRSEFVELTFKEAFAKQLETAFICFGGADPRNLTAKTIGLLENDRNIKEAIVVTGAGYKNPEAIDRLSSFSRVKVSHYNNVSDQLLSKLMLKSDFAIVPSSTILFEILAARLPAVTGYFIDNQINTYKGFVKTGSVLGVGNLTEENISKALQKVTLEKCAEVVSKQKEVIDGRSPERIRRIFKTLVAT